MIAHNRFHSLDGLRGIAALAVMVHHCNASFLPGGYLAVDFFFCLSGFVIARSYGEKLAGGMGARLFMELRLARLYPMILIGGLLGVFLHGGKLGMILLLPDPAGNHLYPTNPPFWSLLDELLVNLGFALVVFRLDAARLLALVLGSAIVLVGLMVSSSWEYGLGPEWTSFHIGLARACFSFAAGLGLHKLWLLRGSPRSSSNWALLLPVALVALMLVDVVDSPAFTLAAMLVIMPAIVWAGIVIEMPGQALWKRLGDLSYPLYCIHMPIIYFAADDAKGRLVAAAVTVVLALAFDHFYDRPMRAWLGQAVRRRAAARQAEGAPQTSGA
jgi:peptidoglycan/LPS O-acetylase OafA/YrhL